MISDQPLTGSAPSACLPVRRLPLCYAAGCSLLAAPLPHPPTGLCRDLISICELLGITTIVVCSFTREPGSQTPLYIPFPLVDCVAVAIVHWAGRTGKPGTSRVEEEVEDNVVVWLRSDPSQPSLRQFLLFEVARHPPLTGREYAVCNSDG